MAASDVRLPDDSGNLGKRVRTQDRVVGANTVQEHYMILTAGDADVQPKIRAGSSAAVAADPSLVVALSPNTALPVGANAIGSVAINAAIPTGANSIGTVGLNTGANVIGEVLLRAQAKGTTAAAGVTSTAEGANNQALDVQIYHGGVTKDPTAIRALTAADVVSLGAGAAAIGSVTTDALKLADVTVKAASTAAVATDKSLVVALSPNTALPVGANVIGSVNAIPPTLTKGTQGATGFSVQNLHDAGRNTRIFMLDAFLAAPVAEALVSVVQWYGNAAVAGTTQPAVVPAGKILRLTGWRITYKSIAVFGSAIVRIRCNTAGLGVLASPLVASFEAGSNLGATTVAIVGAVTTETGEFPEGLDIPAAAGLAFSLAGYGPTGTLTLEGPVRFEVIGYEF